MTYNTQFLDPPLPLPEVNVVAKQVGKKGLLYKCSDAPINAHCNKELCQTMKFGIGAGAQNALLETCVSTTQHRPCGLWT